MAQVAEGDVWLRASDLAEQGDLAAAVRELVAAQLLTGAAQFLEDRIPSLLSLARFDLVSAAIASLPQPHRTLMLRIAYADAIRRVASVSRTEVEQLMARAGQAQRPDLTAWARAILAEQLVMHGDLESISLAHQYLQAVPGDPPPQALMLQARGRLRRIVALAHLASGPDGDKRGRDELERAMADCRRAGWTTEVWLSVSIYHLFSTAISWTVAPAAVHALREARDQLIALNSSQVHLARYAVLHAAFYLGDRRTMSAELAALRECGLTGDPTALPILGAHLEAIARAVLNDEPAALDSLGDADDLRRAYPAMIGSVLARAAHAFLDLGRPAEAEVWHGRLIATPPILPHEMLEREILACRLALANGDATAADRVRPALQQISDRGYPRVTAGLTLRTAMDAGRAGLHPLSARLRQQALALLPDPGQWTAWERHWAAAGTRTPGDGARPAGTATGGTATGGTAARGAGAFGAAAAGRSVRVLAPALEIVVDGQTRRLAPSAARLLLVLVARGRAMGAQELAGLLWGDIDATRARGRLKSALHRLRQSLSLGSDELVVRDGDVVQLVAHPGWSIDLHDFDRLAAGSADDQFAAYGLFGGLLCTAQFPYDDVFAEERDLLSARWSALARRLVAAGALDQAEALTRAQRIGVHLDLSW